MSPLAIVPTYLREPIDAELLLRCLVSLWSTAPAAGVLVIDDHSPAQGLVDELVPAIAELGHELVRRPVNEGFSRTVNVGLRRARDEGRDAILVNADVQFVDEGWLEAMLAARDEEGRPASVVGARLLYPNGLIQHGGVYYSLLHRWFDHRFRFAPADLPEAAVPATCPVTGALQLIRHECLESVGLYDETFRMGYEDVDYCLRVFASGRACVYAPGATAYHHESVIRGRMDERLARWQVESHARLLEKHDAAAFGRFIPVVA